MYVLIYVDDLLVFGTNESQICEFKLMLSREFKMKNLGLVSDFLAINVKQNLDNGVTEFCQKAYLCDTLNIQSIISLCINVMMTSYWVIVMLIGVEILEIGSLRLVIVLFSLIASYLGALKNKVL